MINRREFLLLLATSPLVNIPSLDSSAYGLISAAKIGSEFFITILNDQITKIPISFQPHGIFRFGANKLIVIAKRPGDLMAIVDLKKREVSKIIQLPYGRHFWGHGVFDINAQSFFTTEYDFENEISLISEWNTEGMRQVNAFPSHGISGHDLIISQDKIICANGGFKTSPEFGRMIIDNEIKSSISVIDKTNNNLIESIQPLDGHMSFRHLCQNTETVFIGLQNKTKKYHKNEVIVTALDKSSMQLSAVLKQDDGAKGYITSIKNFKDQCIIATSHTNNCIYLIDSKTKNLIKTINAEKPQGIQVIKNKIYITLEKGFLQIDDQYHSKSKTLSDTGIWENHCLI